MLCFNMIDAFEGQISSVVENNAFKKIKGGLLSLDALLQTLPREILIDDITSLIVTFMEDPSLGNSSIGLDINGLFRAQKKLTSLCSTSRTHKL
uniref:Lipid-binding serum glycoprotein n=1 Tax=Rhizophora mucronata TaxID=61149 RepID=A0A2P2QLN1_RHIMU